MEWYNELGKAVLRPDLESLIASADAVHYNQQYRTCGKERCPCHTDRTKRHGPYWYAVLKHGSGHGRWRNHYIGRYLPVGAEAAVRGVREERTA